MKKKTNVELKLLELWSKQMPDLQKINALAAQNAKKLAYSSQEPRINLNHSSTPQELSKSNSKNRESKSRQPHEFSVNMSQSINASKSPSSTKISYVIQVSKFFFDK